MDDEAALAAVREQIAIIRAEMHSIRSEIETVNAELEGMHAQEEEDVRRAQNNSGIKVTARARAARKLFNEKASKGVKALLDCGEIAEATPECIAAYLLETRGLSKTQIGEYLGEHADFNQKVLAAFSELHDFKDQPFLDSLRAYLWSFRL